MEDKILTKINNVKSASSTTNSDLTMRFDKFVSTVGYNDIFKYYGEWILDNATSDAIYDYFYYRHINDDEKFLKYFQRNMKMYKKQYNNMLRNENIEFDPMITRYLERQVIGKTTTTGTENTTGSKNANRLINNGGTITLKTDNVQTGSGNSTENGSAGYTDNLSGSSQNTHTGNENHQDRTRNILSIFPQANVGSNTGGTLDDNVAYNYASQMTDNKNKGDRQDASTDNGTHSDTNTGTSNRTNNINSSNRNVLDGMQTQTNNSNSNRNDTEATTQNISNNGEENSNVKERLTGRENYDSGTLLTHARDYIATSNAFKWLVNKLEICFIGDLRYGEDE